MKKRIKIILIGLFFIASCSNEKKIINTEEEKPNSNITSNDIEIDSKDSKENKMEVEDNSLQKEVPRRNILTLEDKVYKSGCQKLFLNLKTGFLNGIDPMADPIQIKNQFPCYDAETEDGSNYNHGGGIFYNNFSFYFYTYKDFLNIREGFTGKVSLPILGKRLKDVEKIFGVALTSEGIKMKVYYDQPWGCLALRHRNDKITVINIHRKTCEEVIQKREGE